MKDAGDDERPQERGQQDQQQVVAVEPDLEVHAPGGNPRDLGLELNAGRGSVEARVQPRGEDELQQHDRQRNLAHGAFASLRHDEEQRRAEHGEEQYPVEDGGFTHGATPA